MTALLVDISVIFLLLLCNAFLALTEMAIVSVRKSRLAEWAEHGDNKARLALEIANSPTQFLSAIQIGITLIALLTGIFGGASVAEDLEAHIKRIPEFAPHSEVISVAIVVTILTYIGVIIGELVPKRIALSSPEIIAKYVAIPINVFKGVTRPLVLLLSASTETVVRLLGIRAHSDAPVTEAEIQVLVEQATEAGVFEAVEQEMVQSVLGLDQKRVSSIMTPRRDIEWLDTKDNEDLWIKTCLEVPHSRLLVAEESLDRVRGVIETRALLKQRLDGTVDLEPLLHQPICVPESMNALDLIERFRTNSQELALVLDEWGGVSGVVSREDVFEAIVGNLPMASGEQKPGLTMRDDGTLLCDGQLPIDEFKEALDIETPLPGEDHDEYHTLAGFVLHELKRVPSEGDSFEWNDWHFEVVDMDRHRIDKLLVRKRAPTQQNGS